MIKNLLFIMSLSGSIVVISYALAELLADRYFSLKWKYNMLKISILFYLVPFPEWKYQIMNRIHSLFPGLWEKLHLMSASSEREYFVIVSERMVRLSSKVKIMILLAVVSGIISLSIIVKHVYWYRRLKKIYVGSHETQESQERFYKLKNELGIKRKITYICSEYCKSPKACGVWSPMVVFPVSWERNLDVNDWDMLMKHELIHIRHHDLMIRYLGLLVIAIHWFNPLSYFLFREISRVSEMYCDEAVLRGKGDGERCKYGELLINLAQDKEISGKERLFAGWAGRRNRRILERRILEMRTVRKNKVILSVVTMMLVCMLGGMTCFAYTPPIIVLNERGYAAKGSYWFTTETKSYNKNLSRYEICFVDQEGRSYDVHEDERAWCNHSYSVQGTSSIHTKDGQGGCVIEEYESMKCQYCNKVKLGDRINVITYKSCPH